MRVKKHVQRPKVAPAKKTDTSWGKVADWYDDYLENSKDSYQEKVIAPNVLRVLGLRKGERVLDLACGQGFLTRKFKDAGAEVVGTDIAEALIKKAKMHSPNIPFHTAPAHRLTFAKDASFDVVTIVLAIQNIHNIQEVFAEVRRVLASSGRLVMVMNHPAFRIPKRSSWGWDTETKIQYRRVEGYLSPATATIVMHPGAQKSDATISYHRSLQDFFKPLSKNGFAVTKLEEWISHKESEKGPRQTAEDTARKETPMFLMLEARLI